MKKIIIFSLFIAICSFPAIAGEWLPNFEDIPQMEKTLIIEDDSFVYSVPDGKIIQTTITSDEISRREFQRFYRDALNELGWKKIKDERKSQTFVRTTDELNIEILATEPLSARFTMTSK